LSRSNVVPSTTVSATRYDGRTAGELSEILGLPRIELFDAVSSTLDVTHALGGEGALAGTLVLAEAQTAGRGRLGRSWQSERGAGIWLTLLERPESDEALGVLSLRLALALAPALEAFADAPIRLKWPNDVYAGERKLAGVLVEARWHGARLDWLAIGVGINMRTPAGFEGAALTRARDRVEVLGRVIPALRAAVGTGTSRLTEAEMTRFRERDLAVGRESTAPGQGIVAGVRADGALLVDTPSGRTAFLAGSLVLAATNSLGSAP
jgi:BirA family biotin operon repressor/biotin-[acetyl-CoA-carboxylase] ligase